MPTSPDRPSPPAAWSNWAGNQRCTPARIVHPAGTDELGAAVAAAHADGLRVRAVGSGHSFTDAACTDGVLVALDRHRRLIDVDRPAMQVTVQAGITLADLNDTLARLGLALPNLGDIEYQTLSGAFSTGTHGTGAALGCLATAIVAMELVTADGTTLDLTPHTDPEAFAAAQVSVGALGVVSTITLQCVPAFNLRAQEEVLPFDDVVERFDELADGNDHFEFYWMPGARRVATKRNNRVDGPHHPRSRQRAWYDDILLQNTLFGLSARRPDLARRIRKRLPSTGPVDYVDRSDRVFTSPRRVRFCEMEYGFGREHIVEVLREVRQFMASSGLDIGFPMEVRVTAADAIPLSMTTGRRSAFLACHVFAGRPYEEYFRAIERIVDQVGGRPHWGKLHFQTADTLAPRYPAWERFQAVRRRLDPEGLFANSYTERVLGP